MFCCTATATAEVRQDVIATLNLDPAKLKVFTMSSSRPNLHFEVRFQSHEDDPFNDFVKWIQKVYKRRETASRAGELKGAKERTNNVSGIIYIQSRQQCEDLASKLCEAGIGAKPFHAKLSRTDKDDHLRGWVANREGYDVIVATTAFGMGIDKEDVRFVVHWIMPKSFEGFYQEAGRAGRDQRGSACILYYSRSRATWIRGVMEREMRNAKPEAMSNHQARIRGFEALMAYCENTKKCRHAIIAEFFGDSNTITCDWACDWHKDPQKLKKDKKDILEDEEWCQTQVAHGAYDEMELD